MFLIPNNKKRNVDLLCKRKAFTFTCKSSLISFFRKLTNKQKKFVVFFISPKRRVPPKISNGKILPPHSCNLTTKKNNKRLLNKELKFLIKKKFFLKYQLITHTFLTTTVFLFTLSPPTPFLQLTIMLKKIIKTTTIQDEKKVKLLSC